MTVDTWGDCWPTQRRKLDPAQMPTRLRGGMDGSIDVDPSPRHARHARQGGAGNAARDDGSCPVCGSRTGASHDPSREEF